MQAERARAHLDPPAVGRGDDTLEGEEDRFGIIRCSSTDVRSLRAEALPFIRMMRLMMSTASDEVASDELLLHFDLQRLAS